MILLYYDDSKTLKDTYDKRNNAFDVVRFILAVAVIFSHSYILLLGDKSPGDPLERITGGQISIGTMAVYSFFVISGFLIMQSLISSRSYLRYFKNRILRIYPAFIVSVVGIAVIVGPIITNLPLADYFSKGDSSPIEFIYNNLLFNITGYSWSIKDVFINNPFPGSMNGSMWTLKHEFALYLLLPILSYFLFVKHKFLMVMLTIITFFLSVFNITSNFSVFNLQNVHYWVLSIHEYANFIKLSFYFLAGSLCYLYKDNIIISNRLILLTILLLVFSAKAGGLSIVTMLTLPYLIISITTKIKFSKFRRYGDFSYGMYIYAFPIQQILVYYFYDRMNVSSYFLLSTIFTLIISILSWHLIEKRALSFKSKVRSDIDAKAKKAT